VFICPNAGGLQSIKQPMRVIAMQARFAICRNRFTPFSARNIVEFVARTTAPKNNPMARPL
jgi:hypothetical protein